MISIIIFRSIVLLLTFQTKLSLSWGTNNYRSTHNANELAHRSHLVAFQQQGNYDDGINLGGYVPKGVIEKFFVSVGGPIAASMLATGVAGGDVSDEEMSTVNENVDISMRIQSEEEIGQKWRDALEDESWFLKNIGKAVEPLIVQFVISAQEKSIVQATQMQWINENALPIIQDSQEVVEILGGEPLKFNNTRAKYEKDRDLWFASMNVFGANEKYSQKVGLVNTYFTPSNEVKILVVEIDDTSYNLTWTQL